VSRKTVRWSTLSLKWTAVPNALLEDSDLTLQARGLFCLLAKYAGQDESSYPGQEKLSEICGKGDRMLRNYLAELADAQVITIVRRPNTSNEYVLHPERKYVADPDRQQVSDPVRNSVSAPVRQQVAVEEDTGKKTQVVEEAKAPSTTPPGVPPSENSAPVDMDLGNEWQDWLSDFRVVTGYTTARGSETARRYFSERRAEGWELDDLKIATRGARANDWKHERVQDVPERILSDRNLEGYFLAGQSIEKKADQAMPAAVAL